MDVLSRRAGIDYADEGAAKEGLAADSMSAVIEQLTGFIRRQAQVFVVVPAATIALGLLYLLITPAQYTATATLLIDSSTLRVLQNQLQPQGDIPLDTVQVGSQVEILGSEKIALAVIRELNLAEDPDFVKTGRALSIPFSPSTSHASPKADKDRRALAECVGHPNVPAVERPYALYI